MINGIEKKNISVKELKKDGRYLNAALYTPKTEPGKTYPLVLFLHGAGERGDDLNLVLDFTPGADTFMTDAWQAEHPCFVLAPQCPENQCWVPYVDLLAQSLLEMATQYPVDICRLYVTGVSMGGAGTWELLTRYPHKIAAAMPICGYAEPFKLRAAKDVPVWAFHAEDDPVVPVTGYYHSPHGAVGVGSRMAMSSLRSSGNRDAHYTEYPAGEMENVYHTHPHGSWTAAYQNKEALEWMFGKTRFDRYEIEFICPGVFYMEDYNNDSMYLVEGKEKALLIDTGLGGGNVRKMAESLTSLPVELAVTHAHIDHLLSGDVFEKYYMSKKDVPLLPRLNDGTGKNFTEKDVIDIKDGDVIDLGGDVKIEVAEVEGHTPGSVVFIDRAHKCMFTGDAFGLWMQVPLARPISEYKAAVLRLKEKLQKPGYTELAFLGGHRRQEGGEDPQDKYVPNSYEKIDDMLTLCDLILEKKIEAKPFPMNFGEPAFISTYKTAYMVFMESVRK